MSSDTDEQNLPRQLIREAVRSATPWNVPLSHPDRLCCNPYYCKEKGSMRCSKCRLDAYCSRECQKQSWPSHKTRCNKYKPAPVHHIASSAIGAPEFVGAGQGSDPQAHARALDRQNVKIVVLQDCKDRVGELLNALERQWMMFKVRSDVYGAALYPKTVIMVGTPVDTKALLDILKRGELFNSPQHYVGMSTTWLAKWDRDTPADEHETLLRDFAQVDSEARIMIVDGSAGHIDFIVPHVETVISIAQIADEGPAEMEPRWQRMARMAGQQGLYMQIASDKYDADDADENTWPPSGCHRTHALDLYRQRLAFGSQIYSMRNELGAEIIFEGY